MVVFYSDRSAASADFLWHRRIDGWRKLAGGAGAAAEERARPVAGTVAGVAAKHTGQTSSELQWLGCGSGSSQLVRQQSCGVTAPDLDAAEKKHSSTQAQAGPSTGVPKQVLSELVEPGVWATSERRR